MAQDVTITVTGSKSLTKAELRDLIINSTEESKELKNEIRRVFQVANRRAQNVEKAGLFSPAVQALYNEGRSGYTKFSMKAESWTALKREYGRACAFLEQGTSTATIARKYNKSMAANYGLSTEQLKEIYQTMTKGGSISESEVLTATATYRLIADYVLDEAKSLKSQMDKDATAASEELESEIESTAEYLSSRVSEDIDEAIRAAIDAMNASANFEDW